MAAIRRQHLRGNIAVIPGLHGFISAQISAIEKMLNRFINNGNFRHGFVGIPDKYIPQIIGPDTQSGCELSHSPRPMNFRGICRDPKSMREIISRMVDPHQCYLPLLAELE
jgi:hypothetical protein